MNRDPSASRLERFRSLPAAERWLWIEAWIALAVAVLRLRLAPRRALARALAAQARPPGRAYENRAEAERIARRVASAAAHHLRPLHCLPRALSLRRLLEARGFATRLRIGVRKDAGTVAAHAWVEVGGVPIGEPEAIEARFLPLVVTELDGS